jgi:outer membrane protein assembly factor BamB
MRVHKLSLLIVAASLIDTGSLGVRGPFAAAQSTKPQSAREDWPFFRGVDGSGHSLAQHLPERWRLPESPEGSERDDPPTPRSSSPTDPRTGNLVWRTELPGAGSSTPIVFGDQIYLTCYSGYNMPGQPAGNPSDLVLHLVALDRLTGNLVWKRDVQPRLPEQETIREAHGYASNTPAADDQGVYAFFGKTGVFGFDHSGRQRWQADVGSQVNGWGSGASLTLVDDLVIVNASVESEKLYALDRQTGHERWSVAGIRESWNTPIVVQHAGRSELLLAIFGHILGLDPGSGRELWRCETDIPWYMAPSMVAHEGIVYALGGRPGSSLAVRLGGSGDVTSSHRIWTSKKGGNVSSPIYHDGHLYWMHDNLGIAYCADARTGDVVYQQRVDGATQVYGSPVLAAGRIYYPARDGKVFVVAAEPAFRLLAVNEPGERGTFNASPSVAGERLLLRTDRHLYCIARE